MVGAEVLVGYLIAWGVRKARRTGQAADAETERLLDAGLERLHQAVSELLGEDASFTKLRAEAEDHGEVSGRTQTRVCLALDQALEEHPDAAPRLQALVAELQQVEASTGVRLVFAEAGGTAVGGNAQIHADRGGIAAMRVGDITVGANPSDPSQPGPTMG